MNLIHCLHQILHLLIAQRHFFSGLVGLFADIHCPICRIFCLLVDFAKPRCKFLYSACLLRRALTEHLGARGELAAGGSHLLCRIIHLMHGIAQLVFHMAHGHQNIAEASNVHLLMLRMDIKILVCHLRQHITNILNDCAQSLDQRGGRIGKHARFVLGLNARHRCLQISLHQQLHPLCAGFHRSADMGCHHQRYDHRCNDGEEDHRDADHHRIARRCQIIQLRRSDRNAPSVRILDRRIGGKHLLLSIYVTAKSIRTLTHIRVDRRKLTKRRIAFCLVFYILDGNRVERNVGNRVAGFIDHVCPAVFTNLNG